jgi:hypothetical protein
MITVDRYLSNKIVPMNISGRSFKQIVDNAEATWLAPFLFGHSKIECLEGCHCYACVQKAFDALIAKSDASLADMVQTTEISSNVEITLGETQWQG